MCMKLMILMSRLVSCDDCGAQISVRAAACPRRGAPSAASNPTSPPKSRRLTAGRMIFILILIAAITGVMSLANLRGGHERDDARPALAARAPVARSAPAPTKVKADEEELAKIDAAVAALGKPLQAQQSIYRDYIAAEHRALWEADRLFPLTRANVIAALGATPSDEDVKRAYVDHDKYVEEKGARCLAAVRDRHGISKDAYDALWNMWATLPMRKDEGLRRAFPMPDYPSCDLAAAAKGLTITVEFDRTNRRYHREGCRLAPEDTRKVDLVDALAQGKPCGPCDP